MNDLLEAGQTVMLVAFNQQIIGLVSVMDLPRQSALATLLRLKEIGITHMVMLTGDHQDVGNPGIDGFLDHQLNRRCVDDRQHLFGLCLG